MSTNAKHTPGPWETKQPEAWAGRYRVETPSGVRIADVLLEDDARLIAAAPELLSNLQFAVDLLAPIAGHTVQVERMRAAIAKARQA